MKKLLSLALVMVFGFAPAVFAHNGEVHEDKIAVEGRPIPLRPIQVGELKERVGNIREGLKDHLVATATPFLKEKREEFKGEVRDMRGPAENKGPGRDHSTSTASTTLKRIEFQQDIAKRKAEQTSKVLTATVERLQNILDRVNSRISKVKANGGDTSLAESAVAKVVQDLGDAKAGISSLSLLDLSGTRAKENFETVKTAVRSVEEKIKSAHKNLSEAVRSLKGREGVSTSTEQ